MLLLMVSLASAQLLASRSFMTELAGVGEPFTVRYQLANEAEETLHDVTLFDASLNRTCFKFVEGKTQALLTFGSVRQGQALHVDLDLLPKRAGEVLLGNLELNFTWNNGTLGNLQAESGGSLTVISQTELGLRHVWQPHEVTLLTGFFILAVVVPLAYSLYLRTSRFSKIKRKTN
jgi:hypothetical protein